MPILEDDEMEDRAVLWQYIGDDGAGDPVYDEPEEIFVEFRLRRRQEISSDGTRVFLDATMSAWEDFPVGSRIWVAPDHTVEAIEQWYDSGSAGHMDEVMRVATKGKTRDQKNVETRNNYGLVWDRDNTG